MIWEIEICSVEAAIWKRYSIQENQMTLMKAVLTYKPLTPYVVKAAES